MTRRSQSVKELKERRYGTAGETVLLPEHTWLVRNRKEVSEHGVL